jgi:hypothetical protein
MSGQFAQQFIVGLTFAPAESIPSIQRLSYIYWFKFFFRFFITLMGGFSFSFVGKIYLSSRGYLRPAKRLCDCQVLSVWESVRL